jgi:response regulator RpfG family c-di-GMP phosphodiesterase
MVARSEPEFLEAPYSRWTFDWNEIQRFQISPSRLPQGSTYLNSPQAFWSIHWAAVLTGLAILALLVGFLLAILVNLRTKHRMIDAGDEIIATQRELMASLGDVIETRSEETASHVQRITRLSVRLGDLVGISREQRQQLEIGSSMHDIGKIGIPDDILKNPGKLTPDEMDLMRTHTLIGHSIFCSSPNPSFQIAATIALEHHERWDGQGYPHGKREEEIHLLSRIVSLVDVFDALLTKRLYKETWDPAQVRAHIESESGRAFDPVLARVFLDHWDEFCQLRESAEPMGVPRQRKSKKRWARSPRSVPA